jgi:hypothetical protein
MEDISAWQAFLGTYQSLADWIKALWLIVPPVFILLLTALLSRAKRPAREIDGELVYTVHRDISGQYRILRHTPPDETPALLPLEPTHPALTPPQRSGARE